MDILTSIIICWARKIFWFSTWNGRFENPDLKRPSQVSSHFHFARLKERRLSSRQNLQAKLPNLSSTLDHLMIKPKSCRIRLPTLKKILLRQRRMWILWKVNLRVLLKSMTGMQSLVFCIGFIFFCLTNRYREYTV